MADVEGPLRRVAGYLKAVHLRLKAALSAGTRRSDAVVVSAADALLPWRDRCVIGRVRADREVQESATGEQLPTADDEVVQTEILDRFSAWNNVKRR